MGPKFIQVGKGFKEPVMKGHLSCRDTLSRI